MISNHFIIDGWTLSEPGARVDSGYTTQYSTSIYIASWHILKPQIVQRINFVFQKSFQSISSMPNLLRELKSISNFIRAVCLDKVAYGPDIGYEVVYCDNPCGLDATSLMSESESARFSAPHCFHRLPDTGARTGRLDRDLATYESGGPSKSCSILVQHAWI